MRPAIVAVQLLDWDKELRFELFYNPRLLCERLAVESQRRRRLKKLKGTVASNLTLGHIDSLEFLEIILKSGRPEVIYDIGANVGTWSLLAKACFPKAIVHAFEPLEEHQSIFTRLTPDIPNIFLHKVALGSEAGVSSLHVTSFSDASSLLEIAEATVEHFNITEERQESVTVVPLDEYVTDNKMPLPDLIKLDIQGYELEALRGSEECLKNARYIISEVSFVEFYHGQALFPEIVEFLSKRRFNLYAFGVNTQLGQKLYQTDALFVRES